LDDKEKQEEAARKEAEKQAKEKAKQEEAEWKEAERLSKERAKQEKQEAERQMKEAEKQAKENAKQEEAARKEAEKQAKEKAKQEEQAHKEAERQAKKMAGREKKEAEATPQAEEMAIQPREDTERMARDKAEQEEEAWKDAERLSSRRAREEQEEADRIKREEAQRLAAGKKKKGKEPAGPVLYQGRVKLVIETPVDLGQLTQMEASLNEVAGLQLVMVGGSAGAAHIIVSIEKPLPLLDILGALPVTDVVVKKDKEIRLTLKAK
jgi:hypothetical protein